MKTINAIVKILTALATVAGAVYIIATYGDQIVAWAKEVWAKLPVANEAVPVSEVVPEAPEAAAAEEAPVEAPAAEEPVAEETVEAAEENAPVADEADFAG